MPSTSPARTIELLAPAGDYDSVVAAVRCGANAVYLGGLRLNARKGASTFDLPLLKKAVAYCHARNVRVHLTLNTIVFDTEIPALLLSLSEACEAGVDALIIQDLAVLALAKKHAPALALHASTQLSVHNLAGVQTLATLGFQRVVLARELSLAEIGFITEHSPIEIEAFVHGALCMSISGQCYLSALIGGRSGNRGRCAQPCRLPFASQQNSHALSLKDLSQIQYLPVYQQMGVTSLKIEGRLKRPEYVAAAVTACRILGEGGSPNYALLEAVFSRSGFTSGYGDGILGDTMFGTRRKEDVLAATGALRELQNLYHLETPLVGVSLALVVTEGEPISLTVADENGHRVTVQGEPPGQAKTAPLTPERARASLEKTGRTPFYLADFTATIADDLFVPAAGLNALRRDALEQLLALREQLTPKAFLPYTAPVPDKPVPLHAPNYRMRVQHPSQLSLPLLAASEYIIIPLLSLSADFLAAFQGEYGKIMLELPRFVWGSTAAVEQALTYAEQLGIQHVLLGNLYGLSLLEGKPFQLHGDFPLNVVNHLALECYADHGISSMTMSVEYDLSLGYPSAIPRGIVGYGFLPAMAFRNHPAGMTDTDGYLTDRLGNDFFVQKAEGASVLYNCVPLYIGDRSKALAGLDFITLYFTEESPAECLAALALFQQAGSASFAFTRGLYLNRVL